MTHDAISKTARDQLDAEYESSTQGGSAWWDRYTIRRPGSNPAAPTGKKPPPPPNPPAKRIQRFDAPMAQRHRFGRTLDKPPVRDDFDEGSWLGWLALYFAAVVTVLIVLWLVMS